VHLLSRYITREIAGPTLLAAFVVVFVGLLQVTREMVDDIDLFYITAFDSVRLVFLFLPVLMPIVLPTAYLLGVLLALGRLAEHGEVVAMKAAGIPLRRIVLPLIAGGAVLSGSIYLVQELVQPRAVSRALQIIYTEMPQRITLDALRTGVMHELGDWHVYIGDKDADGSVLYNIQIVEELSPGRLRVYRASEARLRRDGGRTIITMSDGVSIQTEASGVIVGALDNSQLKVPKFPTRWPSGERRDLTLLELLEFEKERSTEYAETGSKTHARRVRNARRDVARRLALPLAAFAVSFAAAPLAVRSPRSGRAYRFTLAGLILGAYYVLLMVLEPNTTVPLNETILRAMAPNIALFLVGLGLLWRVDRV
jgi:lipopolysaccharide export LptBFGC system permease protein LptF